MPTGSSLSLRVARTTPLSLARYRLTWLNSSAFRSGESRAILRLHQPKSGRSRASICCVFSCVVYRSRLSESPHNPKVEGSNPSPATMKPKGLGLTGPSPFLILSVFLSAFLRRVRTRGRGMRRCEGDGEGGGDPDASRSAWETSHTLGLADCSPASGWPGHPVESHSGVLDGVGSRTWSADSDG